MRVMWLALNCHTKLGGMSQSLKDGIHVTGIAQIRNARGNFLVSLHVFLYLFIADDDDVDDEYNAYNEDDDSNYML